MAKKAKNRLRANKAQNAVRGKKVNKGRAGKKTAPRSTGVKSANKTIAKISKQSGAAIGATEKKIGEGVAALKENLANLYEAAAGIVKGSGPGH